MYDSLKQTAVGQRYVRNQLKPITRLMAHLLDKVDWWTKNPSQAKRVDELELVLMPQENHLVQDDKISCGVYSCMHLDRILSWAHCHSNAAEETYLAHYRHCIAMRIFSLSAPPM